MHRVPPGLLFEPSSEAWRRFDPELCIPKSAETFNYDGKWPYAILCPDLTQFFNKETSPVLRYYQSHHIGPWNSKYDYYIYLFKGNPAYWKIRSHEILHGFSKGLEVALWSKNSDKSERTWHFGTVIWNLAIDAYLSYAVHSSVDQEGAAQHPISLRHRYMPVARELLMMGFEIAIVRPFIW